MHQPHSAPLALDAYSLHPDPKSAHLTLLPCTGDGQQVARHVALQLSIDRVHAALKPDEKLAYITSFRSGSGNGGGAAAATGSSVARPGEFLVARQDSISVEWAWAGIGITGA